MVTGQKLIAIKNNLLHNNYKRKLSIQISLSGLSFCVLNVENNTVSHLYNTTFDTTKTPYELREILDNLFETETVLKEQFDYVQAIHVNNLSTIVPKSLFTVANEADYLKFNAKILKSDYVTHDVLEKHDMVNVYVPFVNVNNFIFDKFGSFNYKHASTVLIDNLLAKQKDSTETKCFIHVAVKNFEVVITKDNSLLFYNTFQYNSPEDYIYYILFTLQQLELNAETLNVELLGNIQKDDALHKITRKYIRHVNFGSAYSNFNFETPLEHDYSHFTLTQSLCE